MVKRTLLGAFAVMVGIAGQGAPAFAEGGDAELLKALPSAKVTLAVGVQQAQAKAPEVSISAKFEMDHGGQLALSVYTAEKGLAVDAEHNVLKELIGSPTSGTWKPEVEVFKDVPHVSRSAQQLAVMALSKLTLDDVIKLAAKDQPGTVYSVIPIFRGRTPVFAVKVAAGDKTVELAYDALTGAKAK